MRLYQGILTSLMRAISRMILQTESIRGQNDLIGFHSKIIF